MEQYIVEYYELDEDGGKYLVSETFICEEQAKQCYNIVRNHDRCWQAQLHYLEVDM